MRRLAAIAGLALCLLAGPSEAVTRRLCEVSYESRDGWSRPVVVEVVFATGRELNESTGSFGYGYFDNYALIWFAQDQVAILKITDLMVGVNPVFSAADFTAQFRYLSEKDAVQVNAPGDRRWRIQAKSMGRWIDPRAADSPF